MASNWPYSRIPINGPVPNLSGVCFFHIPPRMTLIERRMIRKYQCENLNATWASELTEQVTHILVESHNPRSVGWLEKMSIDLSGREGAPHVVDVDWIVRSIADGRLHEVDPYRICVTASHSSSSQQSLSVQRVPPSDTSKARSDPTTLTTNHNGELPALFVARVPMWETLSFLKKPVTFVRDGVVLTAGDGERLEREGQELIKVWREDVSRPSREASKEWATGKGEELKSALVSLARSTGMKRGKWILKDQRDLRHLWPRLVVAVADGSLGDSVTVKLQNPELRDYTFEVFIYTRDFDDLDDVHRVLKSIRHLDITHSKIFYKAHALDVLGVYSKMSGKGETRIYTSLFSSKTIPQLIRE